MKILKTTKLYFLISSISLMLMGMAGHDLWADGFSFPSPIPKTYLLDGVHSSPFMPFEPERLQYSKVIQGSTLHRKVVDATLYPWSAVGRVNVIISMNKQTHCTGALLGSRVVLTAAHCLYIPALKEWVKPRFIYFVAGYQRSDFLASSTAKRIIVSPDYAKETSTQRENLENDWALLVLNKPIGRNVGYLGWHNLSEREVRNLKRQGSNFALVGYPRDRKHVISLEENCQVAGYFNKKNLLGHRCKILNGDSGAPLGLLDDMNNFTVVGVNSATGHDRAGHDLNSAVPIRQFKKELETILQETEIFP